MELSIRDAEPTDAAGIVRVLNPIIDTRRYTVLDTPFSVEAERDFVLVALPVEVRLLHALRHRPAHPRAAA